MLSLGELADIKHGWAFKSDFFSESPNENPIVVGIGNFKYEGGFRFENTKIKYYEGDFPSDYLLESGDILLVMTCQTAGGEILGIPGKIPGDSNKYLHNQRLGKFINKRHDLLDDDYAYNLFKSADFNRFLASSASGTKILHTSPNRILQYSFELPPVSEQKAIAHILGTLDDKIELNRKTNDTLEAMAKALFKSWFVDFDPVRAKAEGRPTGLPADISDLFPDSFEDSELGEIPRGWGVAKIDQIIKIQKDSIDPSVTPDETFDHYSIPAFDSGKNPAKELGSSIKSQKFLVGDDDLLVSKLNPSTPRVWIPFSSSARRSICSTEFLVCRASTDVGRAFAYCLASSDSIIEVMTGLAGGTSNSHQRIRPSDFLSLDCCIESQKVRSAFSDVVEPLLRKTLTQRIESRFLASARDALLPKLITGEIRIPDAEKMLEEVGV